MHTFRFQSRRRKPTYPTLEQKDEKSLAPMTSPNLSTPQLCGLRSDLRSDRERFIALTTVELGFYHTIAASKRGILPFA